MVVIVSVEITTPLCSACISRLYLLEEETNKICFHVKKKCAPSTLTYKSIDKKATRHYISADIAAKKGFRLSISVQIASGFVSVSLGIVYGDLSKKFPILRTVPLVKQAAAFALATLIQATFVVRATEEQREKLLTRPTCYLLAPYVLISASMYVLHGKDVKATIVSSAVLGTWQLAVTYLFIHALDAPNPQVINDVLIWSVCLLDLEL